MRSASQDALEIIAGESLEKLSDVVAGFGVVESDGFDVARRRSSAAPRGAFEHEVLEEAKPVWPGGSSFAPT